MASWSKDDLLNFIELYRSLECLWKVKSQGYRNRVLKERAYEQLVLLTKGFEPHADRDMVTKKINVLRTNFRKELRKVENSKLTAPDEEYVYVPKLWYFPHMMFLRDQEMSPMSVSRMQQEEWPSASDQMDSYVVNKFENFPPSEAEGLRDEENFSSDEEAREPPESKETSLKVRLPPSTPSVSFDYRAQSRGSKRRADEEIRTFNRDYFTSHPEDEHDAFAKSIAYKMRKLSPEQCFYAEKLITDVLYEARLDNLSRESEVIANKSTTT